MLLHPYVVTTLGLSVLSCIPSPLDSRGMMRDIVPSPSSNQCPSGICGGSISLLHVEEASYPDGSGRRLHEDAKHNNKQNVRIVPGALSLFCQIDCLKHAGLIVNVLTLENVYPLTVLPMVLYQPAAEAEAEAVCSYVSILLVYPECIRLFVHKWQP